MARQACPTVSLDYALAYMFVAFGASDLTDTRGTEGLPCRVLLSFGVAQTPDPVES